MTHAFPGLVPVTSDVTRPRRRLGILAFSVLTACAPRTTVTPLGSAPRAAPLPADSVTIYRQPSEVPGPYTQIAIVSARGDFTTVSATRIVRALRKEAGRLGANALLLGDVAAPAGARKVGGLLFGGSLALREGQAVAIRVGPTSSVPQAGAANRDR